MTTDKNVADEPRHEEIEGRDLETHRQLEILLEADHGDDLRYFVDCLFYREMGNGYPGVQELCNKRVAVQAWTESGPSTEAEHAHCRYLLEHVFEDGRPFVIEKIHDLLKQMNQRGGAA